MIAKEDIKKFEEKYDIKCDLEKNEIKILGINFKLCKLISDFLDHEIDFRVEVTEDIYGIIIRTYDLERFMSLGLF